MASLKALTLAGAAALALTGAAFGADLLPPPPAIEPLPPPLEFGGWYLRGDVGVAVSATTADLENSPNPLIGLPATANQAFYNTSLSESGLFDIGVGYQYNTWLRGDVTFEYRGGGHLQSLYVLNVPSTQSQYADFYRGSTSSYIGMLNAYANLGTWYGVTPFVGGGIGYASNHLSGLSDNGLVTVNGGATGPSGGYFGDGTSSNFAWALMAGLDFNVTPNLKLELGYRYLNYGKVTSGGSNCLNGSGAGSGFSVANCGGSNNYISSTNTLASNDFRLGLIWMLGEAPPPPVEAPIVRKY